MRRAITAPVACLALVLLAGCGSSNSSSTASTAATTASTASTSAGGLKATTTPKYASPPASSPVKSGLVQIAYRNIAIDPDTIKAKVGSTIKWTNFDSVEHNVTSEGGPQKFASKDFGENGTFVIKANKPGVIHYQCTIHPASMNGTIEVVS
jgi:plastocyanin